MESAALGLTAACLVQVLLDTAFLASASGSGALFPTLPGLQTPSFGNPTYQWRSDRLTYTAPGASGTAAFNVTITEFQAECFLSSADYNAMFAARVSDGQGAGGTLPDSPAGTLDPSRRGPAPDSNAGDLTTGAIVGIALAVLGAVPCLLQYSMHRCPARSLPPGCEPGSQRHAAWAAAPRGFGDTQATARGHDVDRDCVRFSSDPVECLHSACPRASARHTAYDLPCVAHSFRCTGACLVSALLCRLHGCAGPGSR